MLGLHLSDLDEILCKHTLSDEERYCVCPMSVIIMWGQRSAYGQVLTTVSAQVLNPSAEGETPPHF